LMKFKYLSIILFLFEYKKNLKIMIKGKFFTKNECRIKI
jgi:hypothetical protein